jgi:triosephosphate isomerase
MKYLFDNWKMYLDLEESAELAEKFSAFKLPEEVNSAVFPNPISFCKVEENLDGSEFDLGAQNVAWTPKGAYTGATSAYIYSQGGADYALVGHSERRHIFGESNKATKKKVEACLAENITPVLCIGETKEDLQQGDRKIVLGEQISAVFDELERNLNQVIIGYEPVWAIAGSGDGHVCQPKDVVEIHNWIKNKVKNYIDSEPEVVYGGSIESDNILSYISFDEVDGVLLGHASADYDHFSSIVSEIKNYV